MLANCKQFSAIFYANLELILHTIAQPEPINMHILGQQWTALFSALLARTHFAELLIL